MNIEQVIHHHILKTRPDMLKHHKDQNYIKRGKEYCISAQGYYTVADLEQRIKLLKEVNEYF